MPEIPLLVVIAILVIGLVLLLRREHHLLSERDEQPRLDTRGPDDR